jgi:succinyl-CoA synthetase alpha subunit
MAIFVNETTKVLVQGLTGGQGRFHGLRNRDYGTQVVAGVTPGKAGQDVDGIPVYDTVADAVAATGANASFISVPPKAAPAAILEAAAAGVPFVVCITEGIPAHDEARVFNTLQARSCPKDAAASEGMLRGWGRCSCLSRRRFSCRRGRGAGRHLAGGCQRQT